MSRSKDSITLGSGRVYVMEFTGDTIPPVQTIRTEENRIGYIQGGASIEYSAEWYTAKDDLGFAQKTILTDETVVLKTGIMTFNALALQKLSSTARITEQNGTRTLKIGGVGNQDGKKYIILFYHSDPDEGDIAVFIVGKNQAGFTLAFAKDKETVIDAEFSALPMDDEGTLITYIEYDPAAPVIKYALTVEAGSGGSITTGANGQYEAGAIINIAATPDASYNFDGWTSNAGGTFADDTEASTTFTMPAADTTITASFTQ